MSEREWRQHPEFPHEWEGPRTEETVAFSGTELIQSGDQSPPDTAEPAEKQLDSR